jgi:hypothetical protein
MSVAPNGRIDVNWNDTRNAGLLDRHRLTAAPIQRRPISVVSGEGRESNDRADRTSGGLLLGTRGAGSQTNVPPVTMMTGCTPGRHCFAEHCYKWYARKAAGPGTRDATGAEDVGTSAGGAVGAVAGIEALGTLVVASILACGSGGGL